MQDFENANDGGMAILLEYFQFVMQVLLCLIVVNQGTLPYYFYREIKLKVYVGSLPQSVLGCFLNDRAYSVHARYVT